ncbi:MAG: phosphotransferase [Candidatus Latescibacteria bacterium]|nr:phosphotransferase [Candidatus Latescibacterota bacterium]
MQPSRDSIRALLEIIQPQSTAFTIHELAGSYSNHTHLIEAETGEEIVKRYVLRRYAGDGDDRAQKARREYETLKLLQAHQVPAPSPLLVDETGTVLDSPGIVTEFVHGQLIEAQPESKEWAGNVGQTAKMLAQIHATPFPDTAKAFLWDGNLDAVWFLDSGQVPVYMKGHPDGALVWNAVQTLFPERNPVRPCLAHLDYWSGNILWDQGEIVAVVDWEDCGYGDPGLDVAYCRMELFLEGMDDAADQLLRLYEAQAGRPVANLGLWELAATARPMRELDQWLTRPFMAQRFRRFIAKAAERAGYHR